MGVKEEGWSVLIWFCFQTTWCIRTIKISASHSLIALWVSAAGPGPGFGFLAVLPTLWGQVIYFGPMPCLRKPCFSECVSGVIEQGHKVFKEPAKRLRADCNRVKAALHPLLCSHSNYKLFHGVCLCLLEVHVSPAHSFMNIRGKCKEESFGNLLLLFMIFE